MTSNAYQQRREAMLPIHTILHPTDFTEHSDYAFQMACSLARDYGAKLVILHVYPTPVVPVVNGGVYPMTLEVPREKLLEELREIKPTNPTIAVERTLVEGDPAFEIVRASQELAADLIVMGTHGRGGLSRVLMGSVAEAVARKANCPVLTVRTPMCVPRPESAKNAQQELVEIC
jgi:nucleotide-binding universal stress UspA family protein